VKPLLSLDKSEARGRVLSLYKAWWRQIPIMLSQYQMPVTLHQCRGQLKKQFIKHRDLRDTRVIDMLVIKVRRRKDKK
jgi:NADH dehydrogenase (ubiquinone) 1 alpha subcomplex subunit 6